jgi:glycosyltransferase involved in cell wall biosynthesis
MHCNKLNILFVADVSIAHIIGGAERVAFEQCTRLAERGYNVYLMTRKLPIHKKNNEIIRGVHEWRYRVDKRNAVSFLWSTWKNSKKLFESLHQKYQFDCVTIYQPFSGLGVIHSPYCKNVKKNYICFSLSFEEFISRNINSGGPLKRSIYHLNVFVRKWLERKILQKSDQIVVLSEYTKKTLWNAHKLNLNNVCTIPGGIDSARFRPARDRFEVRRNLNIPENKVILFTVRNLVQRMGLQNLILALKSVIKNAPDVILLLGGQGPLKDELIALTKSQGLSDHIRFLGFIPEEKLPLYYQLADFFILPTYELEGFGLVTLEAMASGIPVLGTPVGGTKEILGHFNPKFLFQDASPMSIATLILEYYRKIKQNPYEWNNISKLCRQFVECNYSWEKNVDTLENLFLRQLEFK